MGKNKAASSSEKSALGDWGTPPKLMESVERSSALFINFGVWISKHYACKKESGAGRKVCFSQMGVAGEKLGFPCPILEQKQERIR